MKNNFDFDFNSAPTRLGTSSIKWDVQGKGLGATPLPLGVADSDYKSPAGVIAALQERAAHGVYGYTTPSEKYFENAIWWQKTRFGVDIEKDWIVPIAGIVPACSVSVLAYTNPGDKVIVQAPVYNPFYSSIKDNGREIVFNWLIEEDGYYTIDYTDLEQKFKDGAKMIIFCSPANPVGRVWTQEEMRKVCDIVKKYNAIIVADEIWADLVFENVKMYTATWFTDMYANMVVCTAPSKTFNIAGIKDSNIIIPDATLRGKFKDILNALHLGVDLFGYTAGEYAYTPEGAAYADAQSTHLTNQYNMAKDFLAKHIPDWKFTKQEGTYLLWIDCASTGLRGTALTDAFKEFGMFVNSGDVYGGKIYGGTGKYETFVRVNTACTKETLEKALLQMEKLAKKYSK